MIRLRSLDPVAAISRRAASLAALALFLLGTNFCVFAPPPSLAGAGAAEVSRETKHGCCTAAREKAARSSNATRQATAPCCVAVAPVLAGHGAHVDPAPAIVLALLPALALPAPALSALEPAALADCERPPALHSATPDAGRAPPRL